VCSLLCFTLWTTTVMTFSTADKKAVAGILYFVFSEPVQKYLIKVFQIHIFKSILYFVFEQSKKYLLQPWFLDEWSTIPIWPRLDWTRHWWPQRYSLVRQSSKWDYAYVHEKILDARLCMSITGFEVMTLMWHFRVRHNH